MDWNKEIKADSGGAEALQFEAERALVALSGVWPRAEQRQPQNFHFSPNCSKPRQIWHSRLSPSLRLLHFFVCTKGKFNNLIIGEDAQNLHRL